MRAPKCKWIAVVTYCNNDQGFIMCDTRAQAVECITRWKDAVLDGDKFVTFPCATTFENLILTDSILRVQVAHQDVLDEWTTEAFARRKRIEQAADYPLDISPEGDE